MKTKTITQEQLISQFRNSDIAEVFELKKTSDQILWTLKKIKVDFKLEDYVAVSVLASILVDSIGISVTAKKIIYALNPIKNKIHKKSIEGEISYKIMQEGINHIKKITKEKKTKKLEFEHVSQKAVLEDAIRQVRSLRQRRKIEPGLFYIVFVDLIGSSIASSKIGPEENQKRIKYFIKLAKQALPKKPRSYSVFVKAIGDGALFLFTNFEDVKDWANKMDEWCDWYNQACIKNKKPEIYHLYSKKCIHLGEVHFDDQFDPIALAINQIFKIEKEFKKVQLGITDVVKQVIIPRINSGELKAEKIKEVTLIGENVPRPIWNIAYH